MTFKSLSFKKFKSAMDFVLKGIISIILSNSLNIINYKAKLFTFITEDLKYYSFTSSWARALEECFKIFMCEGVLAFSIYKHDLMTLTNK